MSTFTQPVPTDQIERLEAVRLVCQQAILDIFPHAKLVRSGINGWFFYVDVITDEPFDEAMQKHVVERSLQIVREKRPIQLVEMLKSNAIEYLKSQDSMERAEWMEGAFSDGVIPFLKLDNALVGFPGLVPKNTSVIKEMEILESVKCHIVLKDYIADGLRLWGSVFGDKQTKKSFKKLWKEKEKWYEVQYPESSGWLTQLTPLTPLVGWLDEGMKVRNNLKRLHAQGVEKMGYKQVSTPPTYPELVDEEAARSIPSHVYWHQVLAEQMIEKGKICRFTECALVFDEVPVYALYDSFSTSWPTRDLNFSYVPEEELVKEVISSLQFIFKIINMLEIKCEWAVSKHSFTNTISKKEWAKGVEIFHHALEQMGATVTGAPMTISPGPQIEGLFVDQMGMRWPGPQIALVRDPLLAKRGGASKSSQWRGLYWTLFRSMERWIPLLGDKGLKRLTNSGLT